MAGNPSRLLTLPAELRIRIYEFVFSQPPDAHELASHNLWPLLTCQQIHNESRVLAWSLTTFVMHVQNSNSSGLGLLQAVRSNLEAVPPNLVAAVRSVELATSIGMGRWAREYFPLVFDDTYGPKVEKMAIHLGDDDDDDEEEEDRDLEVKLAAGLVWLILLEAPTVREILLWDVGRSEHELLRRKAKLFNLLVEYGEGSVITHGKESVSHAVWRGHCSDERVKVVIRVEVCRGNGKSKKASNG